MGKALFFLIALILVTQIFIKPGAKKLPWYFAGIMFFPLTINIWASPPISIPRLVIYAMLGTLFVKNRAKEFNEYPFKFSTIFLFVMFFCVSVFDEAGSISKLFKMIDLFIKSFVVMFLTYYYIKSVKDAVYVLKNILIFFFIFCIYGIINYVMRDNLYYNFMSGLFKGGYDVLSYFTLSVQRFRISSFAWHPIYYGFLLAIGILLNLYVYQVRRKENEEAYFNLIVFLFLVINLLLTNSRTPLMAFFFGAMIYFIWGMNWKFKLRIILFSCILAGLVIFCVPDSLKLFSESINTFSSKGSELTGSSVEMRLNQLNASVKVFKRSPVTGNGFGYISEGLGYSSDPSKSKSSDDFAEFESYIFKLLIEQRLCGMIGHGVIFISLIIFFYRHSKKRETKLLSILNIAMLTTFLVFIFGTGDMGAFIFFMSIMGVTIKYTLLLDVKVEASL